jgi:hypothetical protein
MTLQADYEAAMRRLQELEEENAKLRSDLRVWVERVDDPARAHLHYDGCPYKPWADKPDWETPDDRPACTCAHVHKAAYWKGQLVLERGKASMIAQALKGVALNGSDEMPLYSWCDDGWTCSHPECVAGRRALEL